MTELIDANDWAEAQRLDTELSYQNYIAKHKDGQFFNLAEKLALARQTEMAAARLVRVKLVRANLIRFVKRGGIAIGCLAGVAVIVVSVMNLGARDKAMAKPPASLASAAPTPSLEEALPIPDPSWMGPQDDLAGGGKGPPGTGGHGSG